MKNNELLLSIARQATIEYNEGEFVAYVTSHKHIGGDSLEIELTDFTAQATPEAREAIVKNDYFLFLQRHHA